MQGRRTGNGEVGTDETRVLEVAVLGPVPEQASMVAALRQALEDPTLPVTWVEGASCIGGGIAGMQVHAVAGTKVQTIGCGELAVGRVSDDPGSRTAEGAATVRKGASEGHLPDAQTPKPLISWFLPGRNPMLAGEARRIASDRADFLGSHPVRKPPRNLK